MTRRMRIAGAATALCVAAAPGEQDADAEETCELPRIADRQQTSSHHCLVCHDGSTGPGVAFEMGRQGGMSHPVEVDYGAARARAGNRYVPEGQLPPEVVLVDGKVTCTSCHDGASPTPARVVEPARLCTACHVM